LEAGVGIGREATLYIIPDYLWTFTSTQGSWKISFVWTWTCPFSKISWF